MTMPLKEGDSGPRVQALQEALRAQGLYVGTVDGVFGPSTTAAVTKFNNTNKVPPATPGIADAVTLKGLGIPVDDHDTSGFIKWQHQISYVVFAGLLAFVLISAHDTLTQPDQLPRYGAIAALIFLALGFGAWFIACFTGNLDDEWRRIDTFRYAYVFTLTSFAVLVFPVANPWQPEISGPIGIIRGCVDKSADRSAPDSIACVVPGQAGDVKLTPPASAVAAASAPAHASGTGEASVPIADAAHRYDLPKDYVDRNTYTWLIVIGGTYGHRAEHDLKENNKPAASTPEPVPRWKRLLNWIELEPVVVTQDKLQSFSIVQGGFVVPYYVVLLAFIGGAISLTRRIPEYQKQSEPGYPGTPESPRLTPYEVRENVIFEIMQLITAPFIAMVAFYSLAPATTAGGITIAFLSGFASGVILLQLRGLSEGLAPAVTAKMNQPAANQTGNITGTVLNSDNNGVSGATVGIAALASIADVTTDKDGNFQFLNVPVGTQQLSIKSGSQSKSVSVNVTSGAGALVTVQLP